MQVAGNHGTPEDETAILRAAQAGGQAAFGKLVDLHKESVIVYLVVRMDVSMEAEDLAQETFLIAWRRLSEFDLSLSFGAWLRGIAHNLLRNHWRKRRAQPVGGSVELDKLLYASKGFTSEIWDGQADVMAALRRCISSLAPSSRQLIRDRYEEGTDIAGLSKATGRKHSAVTMQLHRIRAELKTCIQMQLDSTT